MIAAGPACLADLAQDRVLRGRVVGRQARQRHERGVELRLARRFGFRQRAAARRQLGELFALLRRRSAAAAAVRLVLLCPERFELRGAGAPLLVELE